MKKILAVALLLLSVAVNAQDDYLQRGVAELDKEAQRITSLYNSEIALNGEQPLLFKKKVEEFLIRRENVENTLTGKDKLDALLKISVQETAEMGDILTRFQLDAYKKIKPDIQPIAVVEQ